MALSTLRSRELVIIITASCGFTLIVEYFFNIPLLTVISDELKIWSVLISGFAVGAAFIRYLKLTTIRIQTKAKNWPIIVYGLAVTLIMTYYGLFYGMKTGGYDWMFNYMLLPVRSVSVALTAPFIFSAGYRAFRARNLDATVFLIFGILLMLYNAPIGEVIWAQFPLIGKWILNIPSTAVSRGLKITAGVGTVAYALRFLLGLEKEVMEE